MAEISLKVNSRVLSTKGARNKLRKDGFVPGVFYSNDSEPKSIYVSEISLKPLVYTSEAHIVNINFDEKETHKAIIKEIQFHPITDRIIHFDLLGVTAGHKLHMQVPVILHGAAIGVKEGGILNHQLHKLDVECLPKDMPEHVEIDVKDLKIGHSIHVKDLKLENVKFLTHEDSIVVSVDKVRVADTTADDLLADKPSEPEVIGKGKSEDE